MENTKSTHQMDEEQLAKIELDWNKAIEVNDLEAMAKYMSDDWVMFSGDGNIITKQMFLQLVKSGDLVHTQMDFEVLNVKVFEGTGIVMQKGTSSGVWKGQAFSNYEIASTVFIKQNEQWLAVQTMLAPATN
ncbi:MAG: nuclear transport factor 2 family protein [Cyclobacteriaceae bacterium]